LFDLYGARGRNRTTDTRIFNADGSRFLFYHGDLAYSDFGVRKSVFLMNWLKCEPKHCVEHSVCDGVLGINLILLYSKGDMGLKGKPRFTMSQIMCGLNPRSELRIITSVPDAIAGT
jgi:hypothetical protein